MNSLVGTTVQASSAAFQQRPSTAARALQQTAPPLQLLRYEIHLHLRYVNLQKVQVKCGHASRTWRAIQHSRCQRVGAIRGGKRRRLHSNITRSEFSSHRESTHLHRALERSSMIVVEPLGVCSSVTQSEQGAKRSTASTSGCKHTVTPCSSTPRV